MSLNITPKFMWTWPSWVVELISGVVTVVVAGAVMLLPWPWRTVVVAFALSYVYEKFYDGNGWSFRDFWQRGIGILFGLWLLWLAWVYAWIVIPSMWGTP